MIKIVLKYILVCVLAFAIASYLISLKTNRIWLPVDLGAVDVSLPQSLSKPKMSTLPPPTQETWRWRENGRWHYGDNPPKHVDAERIDQTTN